MYIPVRGAIIASFSRNIVKLPRPLSAIKDILPIRHISEFNDDWSPFGYARNDKLDTCKIENNPCLVDSQAASWDSITNNIENDFGARSFFIDNYEIKDLGSRYLIDFDKPDQQIIPDIGPLK